MEENRKQELIDRSKQGSVRSGLTGSLEPTTHEIVADLVLKKSIRAEYVSLGFVPSKIMDDQIEMMTKRAKSAHRRELQIRLATAKNRVDELKSQEEKLADALRNVADLTAELEGR